MTATYRSSQWYLDGPNDSTATGNVNGINDAYIASQYNGAGVKAALVDEGFDLRHPDLNGRFDLTLSEDPRDTGTVSIIPDHLYEYHGTATSSVLGGGGTEIVGVAPGSTMAGYYVRTGSGGSSQYEVGSLLNDAGAHNDVVNYSLSYSTPFIDSYFYGASGGFAAIQNAVKNNSETGRGGLGTNFVAAAGNGGIYISGDPTNTGDDTNTHGMSADRHVITVGATEEDGRSALFETSGASLLVSAPGYNILTDMTVNYDGDSNPNNDVMAFPGTSFAAPMVSGIVALMLQANPGLGARDVQEILVMSSHKNDIGEAGGVSSGASNTAWYPWFTNGDTHWNGGANYTNQDFGFGLVDATAAVHLAETWNDMSSAHTFNNESNIHVAGTATGGSGDHFSYGSSKSYTFTVSNSGFSIDRVDLKVDLTDAKNGDITIDLTSPDGTVSHLLHDVGEGHNNSINIQAIMDSTHYWGEDPTGTWTVTFSQDINDANVNTVNAVSLDIYGDNQGTADTYFYTDDLSMFTGSAGRLTLADTNGGSHDTVNVAATSQAATIDLQSGHTSTIKGISVTTDGTIENAVGTHYNDTITGNASANNIDGGPGADTMAGGAGDDVYHVDNTGDVVTEGASAGHDTVISTISYTIPTNVEDLILQKGGITGYGNAGDNTLYASSGGDTLITAGGNDVEYGGAGNDILYNTSGSGTTVYQYGNGGSDYFSGGGAGTTTIMVQSGTGVSTMVGGAGYAWEYAGSGGDYEVAGSGGASMHGGTGADHEYSGSGNDVMAGGAGNDVFVWGPSMQGHDVVTDWTAGDILVFDHTNFATPAAVLASLTSDAGGIYINDTAHSSWAYLAGHVVADLHASDILII